MKHTIALHSELITAVLRGPAVLFITVLSMVLPAQAATFTHHHFIVRACESNGSHAEALTVFIGFCDSTAGLTDGNGATIKRKVQDGLSGDLVFPGTDLASIPRISDPLASVHANMRAQQLQTIQASEWPPVSYSV